MQAAWAAAVVMFVALGSAIGEAWISTSAIKGMSRNPEMYSNLRTTLILGCGLTETTAIYSLVVAILIIFVL